MTIITEDKVALGRALVEAHISSRLSFTRSEQRSLSVRVTGSHLLPFGYDDLDEVELADVIETVIGGRA